MVDTSTSQAHGRLAGAWLGPALAAIVVALLTSPLLVGWEPVGGDPDRLYRPIKTQLARALTRGTLPYWSDQFGTGIPLIAESHIAAFYPPNWLLYRFLDVPTAYRLSMWIHMVLCAAATACYARRCQCGVYGSALAGIAFSLCGSQAIHAAHECHYCAAVYIPICIGFSELYAESGRLRWLAWLAIASGAQWTIGHFQIQTWTACLVLIIGTWRVVADDRPRSRLLGLMIGVGWGFAIATVQLWPSAQLASFVGQFNRTLAARSFYSFPPAHWAELALPRLFRGIPGGPMATYWFAQQTSGYEAALFVGTLPLILAFLGAARPGRALQPWLAIIAVSLVLATMPRWWPSGYAAVLMLPGVGFFRAPGRYTLIASFGIALLAGKGLDRSLSLQMFRQGLIAATVFGIMAAVWAAWWTSRPSNAHFFDAEPLLLRFGLPLGIWLVSLTSIIGWRRWNSLAYVILPVAAVELGALYYTTATQWGPHVNLPEASPVLRRLAAENHVGVVGGELENYPIYAGAATGAPYLGYTIPPPGGILTAAGSRSAASNDKATRWLRRLGVTHQIWSGDIEVGSGVQVVRLYDEALDQVANISSVAAPWTIVKLPDPFPAARVATRIHVSPDYGSLIRHLALVDEPDVAHHLPQHAPPETPTPQAQSTRVTEWAGTSGTVEHDGACILIVTRTYYPGWIALVNGASQAVHPVDGGLQGVRLDGSGTSHVELVFRPIGGRGAVAASLLALVTALAVACWPLANHAAEPPSGHC